MIFKTKLDSDGVVSGVKALGSTLGNVAGAGLKVFTAGVGAAAAGVAALGTTAIQSYAEYEQLVGGIETLFGTGGAKTVEEYAESVGKSVSEVQDEFDMLMKAQTTALNNANEAYKTAGLSKNEYMETVTSFAASLKQSVDNEVEAAEAANQAVIDMADNANKMGTSMESIQNAYNGFAKQNYTMLDNLKLGYGGTKEEMARLLADAEKISGVKYDMSNLADVYSAIHVIQEELGIAGTTAKEATATISGSLNAAKSAWSNLVTGIADDNADFDTLIDNFVDSASSVVDNILPRIEIAIGGIGNLIEKLLPVIVNRIPDIINNVLPDLLQSGVGLVVSLTKGMVTVIPTLGTVAYDLVSQLLTGITENADSVLIKGSEILLDFIKGAMSKFPDLLVMAVDAIVALAMGLTEPNTLNNIITAGIELVVKLIAGITEALPKLLEAAPVILGRLVAGIIQALPQLLVAAVEILLRLAGFLVEGAKTYLNVGKDFFDSLADSFASADWWSIGKNVIDGIVDGVLSGWDWLVGTVKDLAGTLFGTAQDELDINSPSKKFKWIGEMCIAGLDEPIEEYNPYDTFQNSMEANIGGLKATFASSAPEIYETSSIDYERMGQEMRSAIKDVTLTMDGQKVGKIITPTVNDELITYEGRKI